MSVSGCETGYWVNRFRIETTNVSHRRGNLLMLMMTFQATHFNSSYGPSNFQSSVGRWSKPRMSDEMELWLRGSSDWRSIWIRPLASHQYYTWRRARFEYDPAPWWASFPRFAPLLWFYLALSSARRAHQ